MTGQELRDIRDELDLTQGQLAEQLGVWLNTVSGWEIGRAEIPRVVELAATCLQMMHRKGIPGSKPTKVEIEEVHRRMEVKRAEVKRRGKK